MVWDETKSTNDAKPGVPSAEKITATDWNNHVADQKNHVARHESGGSDAITLGNLAGISSLVTGGSNVTVNFDGTANTYTVAATDTDTQLTAEEIEDTVAQRLVGGTDVTVTQDDPNDQIIIDVSASGSSLTAGDGLVNSSGTLNIEPADFAGAGLVDDGSDNLAVDSTVRWTQSTVTSNTTATDMGSVWADASSSSVTVTLPTPTQGYRVRVKAINASNGVTVARSGTENINGQGSDLSLVEGESVELESDGTNWEVM